MKGCSQVLFGVAALTVNGITSLTLAVLAGLTTFHLVWSNRVEIQFGPGVEQYFPEIFLWGTSANQMQLAFAQTAAWLIGATTFFAAFITLAIVCLGVYIILRLSQ